MTDQNQTTAAEANEVAAADVSMAKAVFHFKTEKMKNEKGESIGEGKKHPTVEINLPVPTVARLQEFLSDTVRYAKEVELLIGVVTDQVYRVARGQINDFREKTKDAIVTAASLDYSKLDFSAIANMPKAERASSVPSDDDIKLFLASYLDLMPAALNKPKTSIENHVICFQTGFKKQRSQKDILEMFTNALAVYVATAGDSLVEDHLEVIEYYTNRLGKLMTVEEKITMDDL